MTPPALAGRRVVVTRAAHQAPALAVALEAAGATPVLVPVLELAPPADGGRSLRAAIDALGSATWLAVTSVNAVTALLEAGTIPEGVKVAAVGAATAAALDAADVGVDLIPDQFTAAALAEAFPPGDGTVVLPLAAGARPTLADGLRAKGWSVVAAEAYRTVPRRAPEAEVAQARSADATTFASPSAVDAWLDGPGREALAPVVACIGPVTARALLGRGVEGAAVANPATVEGLVDALIRSLGAAVPSGHELP